ncbi:hypothetical protein RO575_19335 [Methylomonas sp. MO1]|uniref:hypothetical protein n=1 Tax=Methylomonas sp. MO1 TaxID=3073619 RepID=UPI0028A47491|nr:hypothetical protein [Methylomonas sp. MO1]MDT4291724.1 hypothetical protein [Methylomonas sp. MO1]
MFNLMFWLLDSDDDWLFGANKESHTHHTAQRWFDHLFVTTGIRESVFRYFILVDVDDRERLAYSGYLLRKKSAQVD